MVTPRGDAAILHRVLVLSAIGVARFYVPVRNGYPLEQRAPRRKYERLDGATVLVPRVQQASPEAGL